jgi:hypothetical protein
MPPGGNAGGWGSRCFTDSAPVLGFDLELTCHGTVASASTISIPTASSTFIVTLPFKHYTGR